MSEQQPTAADIVMNQQAEEMLQLKYQIAVLQLELEKTREEKQEKEGE